MCPPSRQGAPKVIEGNPLRHAQPAALKTDFTLLQAAQCVLRESFCQFSTNLDALRFSDDPEVVHHCRVGWRRFKSALRLFKPVLPLDAVPPWRALRALLGGLDQLRELDVAQTDTLAPMADVYSAGNAQRALAWAAMLKVLTNAATTQRQVVRSTITAAATAASLALTAQWIESLPAKNALNKKQAQRKVSLRSWAWCRITRQHQQLSIALWGNDSPERQHRNRLLAKQLRYSIEALRPLLPRRPTQAWLQEAVELQTRIGLTRDVIQASVWIAKFEVDRELLAFLRGLAAGHAASLLKKVG